MTSSKSKPAAEHFSRSHDYAWLVRRWRSIARSAGLRMHCCGTSGGLDVFHLHTKSPAHGALRLYLSAGIHGDESASTEALLAWVSRNTLAPLDLTIFPCLNPWGLVHNKRTDADGIDLNRCYHDPESIPHLAAQARIIRTSRFDLAINLHEDYDARGIYLYEPLAARPHLGEHVIEAMSKFLPADPRSRIDGHRSRLGVIRRRATPATMPEWPEAFLLHFGPADRTLTLETPSEAAIERRVEAHCAGIDAALAECKRHLCNRPRRA